MATMANPALAAFTAQLRDELAAIEGIRILDRGGQRCAIVTFVLDGWNSEDLKAALDAHRINAVNSFREYAQTRVSTHASASPPTTTTPKTKCGTSSLSSLS